MNAVYVRTEGERKTRVRWWAILDEGDWFSVSSDGRSLVADGMTHLTAIESGWRRRPAHLPLNWKNCLECNAVSFNRNLCEKCK